MFWMTLEFFIQLQISSILSESTSRPMRSQSELLILIIRYIEESPGAAQKNGSRKLENMLVKGFLLGWRWGGGGGRGRRGRGGPGGRCPLN